MNDGHSPGSAEPQLRPKNNQPAMTGLPCGAGAPRSQEWYSRGYLPHRDRIGLLQAISFRLADSLPQEKLRVLKEERERRKNAELGLRVPGLCSSRPDASGGDAEHRKKIEAWLDAGMGCCALRNPQMANVVEETLLQFDGEKYRLIAWCIMPNHVHVLIEPMVELKRIVQSWKSFTGRWALAHNAELGLGVPGKALWMPDYWDRYIRDEKHLTSAMEYIHNNPVKAGLCAVAEQWPWSSAGSAEPQLRNKERQVYEL